MNNVPFAPTTSPMIDERGFVTQIWSAFFDSIYQEQSVVPSGCVLMFEGPIEKVPNGFLVCDGSELSISNYPDLYDAIGNRFGGTDLTFKLPDRRGKFAVGANSAAVEQGGSTQYVLTLANLPPVALEVIDPGHTHVFTANPHNHVITDLGHVHNITDPGHVHTLGAVAPAAVAGAGAVNVVNATGNTGSSPTGVTINNALTGISLADTVVTGANDAANTGVQVNLLGSSTPFSILPPYLAAYFIIKT